MDVRLGRPASQFRIFQYSDPQEWNNRYAKEITHYDWYVDWPVIKPVIREYISHKGSILHVGCGTSTLGEQLINDGYKQVVNLDISDVLIKSRTSSKHSIYRQGDVRKMEMFCNSEFDAVIDKGTIDSLMCSAKATLDGGQALSEIYRVLKPGGVYLCFSHAAPSKRVGLLGRPAFKWSVTYVEIPRTIPIESSIVPNVPPIYCYACRKCL